LTDVEVDVHMMVMMLRWKFRNRRYAAFNANSDAVGGHTLSERIVMAFNNFVGAGLLRALTPQQADELDDDSIQNIQVFRRPDCICQDTSFRSQ
jgi:hypothetical protein